MMCLTSSPAFEQKKAPTPTNSAEIEAFVVKTYIVISALTSLYLIS
jgi:hypothetical protein